MRRSDRLPAPEEDEYYHYQLIGLRVVDVGGTDLGAISAILETGSNDVYVVVREGREILVPGIHEVVRGVDLEAGCMYVDLPEGLVE
jgi:16S rRNA processing protein RimM